MTGHGLMISECHSCIFMNEVSSDDVGEVILFCAGLYYIGSTLQGFARFWFRILIIRYGSYSIAHSKAPSVITPPIPAITQNSLHSLPQSLSPAQDIRPNILHPLLLLHIRPKINRSPHFRRIHIRDYKSHLP